jgi:type II secretory pathway component PulJ
MPSIRSELAQAGLSTAEPRPAQGVAGLCVKATDPAVAIAGFSLIEVLAALVVTMLLVLALTPFAGQMLSTWARGGEVTGLVEAMTRGVGILRGDLRHAIAGGGQSPQENPSRFRGNEVSLSFLSATGLEPGPDGVQMISIAVEASQHGRALVRRRAPLTGSGTEAFADPVALLSGPFSYRFTYHSRQGQESLAWTNPHELPARVELSIANESGPIFKAPLEFPVLASVSAACLTDNELPGCPNPPSQEEEADRWAREFGYTGDQ